MMMIENWKKSHKFLTMQLSAVFAVLTLLAPEILANAPAIQAWAASVSPRWASLAFVLIGVARVIAQPKLREQIEQWVDVTEVNDK